MRRKYTTDNVEVIGVCFRISKMSKQMAFTFDSSNNTCQAYTVPYTTYTYTSGIFTTYHKRRWRRRWRCHTKWKLCFRKLDVFYGTWKVHRIWYHMTSCPQRCFISFSQRCWNNRKTILFTKFSKSIWSKVSILFRHLCLVSSIQAAQDLHTLDGLLHNSLLAG
jgi:hypothetical protein